MIDAGQVTIFCHSRDIGTTMKDNGDGNGNENINATDIGDNDNLDQAEEGVLHNINSVMNFNQVEEGVEVEAPGPAMRPGDGYTWSRQVLPHLLNLTSPSPTSRATS